MPEPHDHDRGLAFDLATLLDRRSALRLLAGVGAFVLVGCADDGDDAASSTTTTTTADAGGTSSTTTGGTTNASCEEIPAETAGPFPGDGSNGPNVLTESGVVRSDITASFGGMSGQAEGVPLTVNLVIQDQASCQPLAGAAVYLWHCDREGRYSLYSQGATNQNYLRGVQEAGTDGRVSFTSIFPGAYSGRWPHIHFEVYRSVADATGSGNPIATSQLAFPQDACEAVYAAAGYEASVRNLAQTSLVRDLVFSDGSDQQMAAMSGSAGAGYAASLTVPV